MSFLSKIQRISATVLENASTVAERAAKQAEKKGNPNAENVLSQAKNMKYYAQDLREQALSKEKEERSAMEEASPLTDEQNLADGGDIPKGAIDADESSAPIVQPEPLPVLATLKNILFKNSSIQANLGDNLSDLGINLRGNPEIIHNIESEFLLLFKRSEQEKIITLRDLTNFILDHKNSVKPQADKHNLSTKKQPSTILERTKATLTPWLEVDEDKISIGDLLSDLGKFPENIPQAIAALETEFGIRFPSSHESIRQFKTLRDIISYVANH